MPPSIDIIKQILDTYAKVYPGESISSVSSFVNSTSTTTELYDRKNFKGHITASALVFDSDFHLLVISHAVFHKFLPPGGHVELNDTSLLNSALREAKEETNLQAEDVTPLPAVTGSQDFPFDINSHEIPVHPSKKEPAHTHHDFRYLFRYNGTGFLVADPEETNGFQWTSPDDITRIGIPGSDKIINFFKSIAAR